MRFMVGALALLFAATVQAANSWSVTPVFGWHHPKLDSINYGSFVSDLVLMKTPDDNSINADPNNPQAQQTTASVFANDLPLLAPGGAAGAEFYWRLARQSGFVFGFSNWEGASSSPAMHDMTFQKSTYRVSETREAKISYTQFYVGWRRQFFGRGRRFQMFSTVTLHELFDIDYQDRFVLNFGQAYINGNSGAQESGDLTGNKRVIIFKSQATGGLNLGVGMGAEYFITKWFSLGLQGNYFLTLGDIFLKDFRVDHDLISGDGYALQPTDFRGPIRLPKPNESSGSTPVYYSENSESGKPMNLDFGGWGAVLRLNFYF